MLLAETDHWSSNTRNFLGPYLSSAQYRLRVATGFFSVAGYDLIKGHLASLKVDILVGYDEHSHERLKEKLIEDIMVHLSCWDTANRRPAVLSLVEKMERRELQIHEQLEARIRERDHAKIYLIDDSFALTGSANLTRNGLIHNAEGMSTVEDPERVEKWCNWFEKYWTAPDTWDLTQELLDELKRWLELRSPYDVYLKTINALVPEDRTAPPRASYKKPTDYQQVVIERSLRQLRDWRGSFIVASTGLGKTIMATHIAFRLLREGKILNALIFAPKPVRQEWVDSFATAGVNAQVFTRNNLDREVRSGRSTGEIQQLEDALSKVDEQTLIVLDETQYFVNRVRANAMIQGTRHKGKPSKKRTAAEDAVERLSFQRLMEVVGQKKPRILLLTATPLVKDPEDLNNQLMLLPHLAPNNQPNSKGQHAIAFPDDKSGGQPWLVQTTDDHFSQFMNLPVVTVISTSYVAKTFAVQTERGDCVDFNGASMWIPQIEIHRVGVPLPLEREMGEALDNKIFRHTMQSFPHRGQWRKSETNIETMVTVSWASSPRELARTLHEITHDLDATVRFKFDRTHRQKVLQPILDKLQALRPEEDVKLLRLRDIVENSIQEHRKVLVYSERRATCHYLEESLKQLLPEVRVAGVVRVDEKGGYELRDEDEVQQMIVDFAPEANKDRARKRRDAQPIDVLISTDAYGVGVNLQDASVVVDYDLSWTPDTLVQRAGRILRFWSEPRTVKLFIFVGKYQEYRPGQAASRKVDERLRRLTERGKQAQQYTEMPVIPEQDKTAFASLAELSSVEYLGQADVEQIEEFSGVTRFLQHTTELKQHLDYFRIIPDDITSARTYDGKHDLLYVLLRFKSEYSWVVVDLKVQRELTLTEDPLLDLLACEQGTEVAAVSRDLIEELAQKYRLEWAEKSGITDIQEVERICALYLLASGTRDNPERMLRTAVRSQMDDS